MTPSELNDWENLTNRKYDLLDKVAKGTITESEREDLKQIEDYQRNSFFTSYSKIIFYDE